MVVMVQPAHDRKSDHLVPCMMRGHGWSAWSRNLLLDPLMRSCLVEVLHIGIEHPLQLLLLQDEQVVQAFFSDAPQEALTDRIGSWGMNRRFEKLNATGGRHASKTGSKLAVVITNQVLGRLPVRGSFSQLLRHPGICRRAYHAYVDHLP